MTDNKFKSKQEVDEYIKNNSTSFEEFEKKLDYSLFEKRSKKNKKHKGFSLKKLGYAIVSFVVVIGIGLGLFKLSTINTKTKCPYELGTYNYYSQEGNIDGLDFSEKSYIVLTDQELSGPGTFVLQNKDWVVYGQFYECGVKDSTITYINNVHYIDDLKIEIAIKKIEDVNFISFQFEENGKRLKIDLKFNNYEELHISSFLFF